MISDQTTDTGGAAKPKPGERNPGKCSQQSGFKNYLLCHYLERKNMGNAVSNQVWKLSILSLFGQIRFENSNQQKTTLFCHYLGKIRKSGLTNLNSTENNQYCHCLDNQ